MVVEQASEQVLPATYLFLGRALRASPSELGILTLSRAMVQTLSSPLSGVLGTIFDRSRVLAAGALLWGVMTAALAASTSLPQACLFAAVNGMGLALLVPCACSLTADLFPAAARGRAFGVMTLTGATGGMLGGLFATNLGARGDVRVPWPLSSVLGVLWPMGQRTETGGGEGGADGAVATIEGWRLAYLAVAAVSLAVGLLVLRYARDPRPGMGGGDIAGEAGSVAVSGGERDGGGVGSGRRRLSLGGQSGSSKGLLLSSPSPQAYDSEEDEEDEDPDDRARLLSVVVAGGGGGPLPSSSAPLLDVANTSSLPASNASVSPVAAKHRHAAALAAARARSPALPPGAAPSPPTPLASTAAAKRRRLAVDIARVLRIPTFQVIVAQGVVGSFPWQALVFLLLWLQLLGFSDGTAAALVAIFQAGVAVGGLLGGAVADRAARAFPERGRVMVAQFSVASGLPLVLLLFRGLPAWSWAASSSAADAADASLLAAPPSAWPYALCLLLLGLLCSWCGAGVNSPIFAELVPDDLRSTIFAFDRSFESALAACAAPVVGFLAERRYGFSGKLSEDKAMNDPLVRRGDARALGSSLLLCTALPWTACLCFYTALYRTYPRDKRRARAWAEERAAALAAAGGEGGGGEVVATDDGDRV
jgi:MFS family permease